MFKTFFKAFSIKEIRNKLLFTFCMLIIIRLGCRIPVPGVNPEVVSAMLTDLLDFGSGSGLDVVNAFTGGSFLQFSIFALNITPYITSSIIIQLLTIAIPKLEEMQKDGEDGRKKIAAITRYTTVVLAMVESGVMAIGFGNRVVNGMPFMDNFNVLSVIVVIVSMTAGSTFLMWLGERINEKGIGNGISIVLVINILSSLPSDFLFLYEKFIKGQKVAIAVLVAVIIIAIVIGMIVLVIYLSNGTRKIPVQYAKKTQGNRLVGASASVIPVRVNTAGVIPIIFASSILQFPAIISGIAQYNGTGWWSIVLNFLNPNKWFVLNKENWYYTAGLLLYVVLVVVFAYFYTSITFNPVEIANNLKRQGGFIPGIRPGKPTSDYLNKVLNYIIFIGAIGLIIVAIIPYFFNGLFGAQVSFGGTSIIIVVGVIVETVKQVESQMLVRNYKGFLND